MTLLGITFSASAWIAPTTAFAAMAGAAAVILLRDHLRLERHALALEGQMARLQADQQRQARAGARNEAIVAAQRDLIVLRDPEGFVTFANKAFTRFLPPHEDGVGRRKMPQPVRSAPPRPQADGTMLIEEAYAGDEGERWVQWIETPMADSSRPGTLRVGRPIDAPAPSAMWDADACFARQFRAPLGGIVGLATLLLDTALDGEQAIHARRIKALAEDLVGRIEPIPAERLPAKPASHSGRCRGATRVLLAEDDEVNGLFAVESLELAGAVVDWARDGEEALRSVESSFSDLTPFYDLVLMDIRMPRLDGIEATRRIRALEAQLNRAAPLRIIALTATTMPQDRMAAEAAGISGFLAKPYRADALAKLLPQTGDVLARAS